MVSIAMLGVLLGIALSAARTFQGSNCGGNTAALYVVHKYQLVAEWAAAESPNHEFAASSATAQQREDLESIANNSWIGGSHILVSSQPYRPRRAGPRTIVAVCDTPYRNVPRRILGLAPPTHAAAYSDGSVGLISVAEFEALDRTSLIPLDELLAACKGVEADPSAPAQYPIAPPSLRGSEAPRRTPRSTSVRMAW